MGGGTSRNKVSGGDHEAQRNTEEVTEAAQLATGGLFEQDLSSRVEVHCRVEGVKRRINARTVMYTKRGQDKVEGQQVCLTNRCYAVSPHFPIP